MRLFTALKNPINIVVALSCALLFFDMSYYFMSKLPGHVDNMCVVGANFTMINIVFAILISLMTGMIISGGIELYRMKASSKKASLLGSAGIVVGTFTVFCTTCSLPVISLFGLSVGLTAFTDFNIWFKVLSLGMMVLGMYFLERQLAGECQICKS